MSALWIHKASHYSFAKCLIQCVLWLSACTIFHQKHNVVVFCLPPKFFIGTFQKVTVWKDTLCNDFVNSCSNTIISHILTSHVHCSLVPFSKLVRAIVTNSKPCVVDTHFDQTRNIIYSGAIILGWCGNRGSDKPGLSKLTHWRKRKNNTLRMKSWTECP